MNYIIILSFSVLIGWVIYCAIRITKHQVRVADFALLVCLAIETFCVVSCYYRDCSSKQTCETAIEVASDSSSTSLNEISENARTEQVQISRNNDYLKAFIERDYHNALNSTLRLGLQPGVDIGFKTDSIEVFHTEQLEECGDYYIYQYYNYDTSDSCSYSRFTEKYICALDRGKSYVDQYIQRNWTDNAFDPALRMFDGCWCYVKEHNGHYFYYEPAAYLKYLQFRDDFLIKIDMEANPFKISSFVKDEDCFRMAVSSEYYSDTLEFYLFNSEMNIYRVESYKDHNDFLSGLIAPAIKEGDKCKLLTINVAYCDFWRDY